jgi:hypothetical protein
MSFWSQSKKLYVIVSAVALVALLVSLVPLQSAEAAPAQQLVPAFVLTPINGGWTKFSWVPSVRGSTFSFSPIIPAIVPSRMVTVTYTLPESQWPSLLTFTATANVACPQTGSVTIPIRVYDFGQLVNTTSAPVDCSMKYAYTDPTVIHTPDEYASNPHYLHAMVSIPSGGAHSLVVEADLPTTDMIYWGYVRVDSAPNTMGYIDYGNNEAVIAATVVNPPANAWIGVQWADPTGTTWTMIDTWLGPLDQATLGRTTRAVDPKDFGTGPYRWVVYDNDPAQGGKLWGVSNPFNFPRAAHDWLWTQIWQTVR